MQLLVRSVVVVLMLVSGIAVADPLDKPQSSEAREHLEKGNALLTNREFEAAIDEYKAGALVENSPLFQYNIALSYRLLGKYKESIWFYERFISRAHPTGEMLDAIRKLIDQMKAELEQRAKTQPPTEPAASTETVADATPGTSTTPALGITSSTTATSRGPDWFGIGLVSAGAVGVLVGGGLLWDASSLRGDADQTNDQTERDALYEKADTRTLVGGIVGGVGVAVLATGVIKLVVGRGDDRGRSSSASWNMGVSRSGFYVFGRF